MKRNEILTILERAYKGYVLQGLIADGVNVADYMVAALDWDLELKLNLYFAKREQAIRIIKEKFNFKYEK